MKDTVNKENISSVNGGAAEAVRDITDENDLNAALQDLSITLNDRDLAKEAIQQPIQGTGYKCPTCPSKRREISVLF